MYKEVPLNAWRKTNINMMFFWRLEPDKNTDRTLNFGSLTTLDLGIPEEF